MNKQERQVMYVRYLEGKGYKPRVAADRGNVVFHYRGERYVIEIDESDEKSFKVTMVLPLKEFHADVTGPLVGADPKKVFAALYKPPNVISMALSDHPKDETTQDINRDLMIRVCLGGREKPDDMGNILCITGALFLSRPQSFEHIIEHLLIRMDLFLNQLVATVKTM